MTAPKRRRRARRASPITTARPASSSAARQPSSRSTSSTRSCSSSARSSAPTSGSGWSPTSATSTRTWRRRSPPGSAWRSCRRTPPAARPSRTCRRHPRSASWPTDPTRSPVARSACSSPTVPTQRLKALQRAIEAEGADVELIAPTITGATLDDGTLLADQMVGGGPSVLYDAVAVLASSAGASSWRPAGGEGLRHRRPRPLQGDRLRGGGATLFDAAGLSDMLDGATSTSARDRRRRRSSRPAEPATSGPGRTPTLDDAAPKSGVRSVIPD